MIKTVIDWIKKHWQFVVGFILGVVAAKLVYTLVGMLLPVIITGCVVVAIWMFWESKRS